MAKCKIFEPSVAWHKEYVVDTAPGIDKRLWRWHRNSNPDGMSKYAATGSVARTMATINTGVWNALVDYIAALGLKGDTSAVAIGRNSIVYMAETALPDGSRQIATFNTSTRAVEAATVSATGRYLPYDLSKASQECGRVIFLAMFPELLKDEEAQEAFNIISDLYVKDDIENETAGNAMSKLSDNFYRRIEGGIFDVKIPTSGNVRMIPAAKVKTGAYSPETIIGGTFKIFTQSSPSPSSAFKKGMTVKEAKEMFKNFTAERNWTSKELELIELTTAEVSDDDLVDEEVYEIAEYIVASSKDKNPIRNFISRGETGIGKSYRCKMLAKVLGIPYLVFSCNPDTETHDFLSKFVPCTEDIWDGDENNKHIPEFPTFEEMAYDPITSYKKLTGIYDESATSQMCFDAYGEIKKIEGIRSVEKTSNANGLPRFKLVQSDYVTALSKGYLIEIQEPSLIVKSGVLGGLNEYNRPGSIIPLPDGKHVVRHKDAIVFYTDNVTYEGCRPLNQAVIRRAFAAFDSYEMQKTEILERVKNMSEFDDDDILEQMYEVWNDIRNFCKDKGITDGSTSIVELANWAQAVRIKGYEKIRKTCIETVVAKATAYQEEREAIIASCVDKMWLK